VTIKVRYADFTTVTRSHTEEPATHEAARIAARALMLLERTDAGKRSVRLLGVGAHGLGGVARAAAVPAPLPFAD
jgi:DNA polymerase-4